MDERVIDRASPPPAPAPLSHAPPLHDETLEKADAPYLAPWGRREIALTIALAVPLAVLSALAAVLVAPWWWLAVAVELALAAFLVLFFRNPRRTVPAAPAVLVSPADGTVWDVEDVDEDLYLHEPAVRIGIFLSIFDVHVNRAPAAGKVEFLRHRPGRFHDARSPHASNENECQWIGMRRDDLGGPAGVRLLIRQVSGAVARRIVCPLAAGTGVSRGGLIGMIKYGSRTEIFVPRSALPRVLVEPGDKVRGGESILVRIGAEDEPRGNQP